MQYRRSYQHSKGHATTVEDMGTRLISAQAKVAARRELPKEAMVRRGSRHRRQQANQDSLEEERITKEASMARLRESQAKAKVGTEEEAGVLTRGFLGATGFSSEI